MTSWHDLLDGEDEAPNIIRPAGKAISKLPAAAWASLQAHSDSLECAQVSTLACPRRAIRAYSSGLPSWLLQSSARVQTSPARSALFCRRLNIKHRHYCSCQQTYR